MKLLQSLIIFGLISVLNISYADTLMLDVITETPPNTTEGLLRPKNGASQNAVNAKFGEPNSKTAAVGYPPISSWVYDKFTVYFEYKHVITTVVHRE